MYVHNMLGKPAQFLSKCVRYSSQLPIEAIRVKEACVFYNKEFEKLITIITLYWWDFTCQYLVLDSMRYTPLTLQTYFPLELFVHKIDINPDFFTTY